MIGQVPSVIETLSQELHTRSLKTQYNMAAAAGGGSKTKSRKKTLSTRESVSSLLRGTLNKIRGGGGGENKPAAGKYMYIHMYMYSLAYHFNLL